MFGYVAGRERRSRWVIVSFLFALAFAWSFAMMGDRVGGFWNLLRLGLAVGLGISLLRLVLTFISSRRLRGAQEEGEWRAKGDEGAEMEAEGQPPAEEPPPEEPARTSQEDLQALQPDSDGAVDQVKAPEADDESQESLRRKREEFKARAKEAELRVKQREAELHEAASAPESKQ